MKGLHVIRTFDVSSKEAQDLEQKIVAARRTPEYRTLLAEFQKFKVKETVVKNLVVNKGLEIVLDVLADIGTYSGNVSHGAVGTGATAAAGTQTQLVAEVARTEIADVDNSSITTGQVVISFFFTKDDFNNTSIREWGLFVDGTAALNSGSMFLRTLFGTTVSKNSSTTLTVDSYITATAT